MMDKKTEHWMRDMLVKVGRGHIDEYLNTTFHGRNIRVTSGCEVEIDDGDMDRWANSHGASFYAMPGKKRRRDAKFVRDFEKMISKVGMTPN